MAEPAGWRLSDLLWERLAEAGLAAFDAGALDDAGALWMSALAHAEQFSAHDPRRAATLGNLAAVRQRHGGAADADAFCRAALAAWTAAETWVDGMTIAPRARSSLFRLRLEGSTAPPTGASPAVRPASCCTKAARRPLAIWRRCVGRRATTPGRRRSRPRPPGPPRAASNRAPAAGPPWRPPRSTTSASWPRRPRCWPARTVPLGAGRAIAPPATTAAALAAAAANSHDRPARSRPLRPPRPPRPLRPLAAAPPAHDRARPLRTLTAAVPRIENPVV